MRWAGHVAGIMEKGNAYTYLLLRKQEGKRPLGKPRPMWAVNFMMNFVRIGFTGGEFL
jgi:hypothetical protein